MKPDRKQLVVGVAECVDLPDWGVSRLRAKIDTGARTSALHVDRIEETDDNTVRFSIVLHRDRRREHVTVEAPIVRRSRVRSSSGRSQERIIVATRIVLAGVERTIEISLASRRQMIFRMLLGRSALAGDFLIDPSRRYVCSKPAKRKKKRDLRSRAMRKKPVKLAKKKATRRTKAKSRSGSKSKERRER